MYRKALDWDQVRTFMKKISAVLLCGMISLSASASDLEDLAKDGYGVIDETSVTDALSMKNSEKHLYKLVENVEAYIDDNYKEVL